VHDCRTTTLQVQSLLSARVTHQDTVGRAFLKRPQVTQIAQISYDGGRSRFTLERCRNNIGDFGIVDENNHFAKIAIGSKPTSEYQGAFLLNCGCCNELSPLFQECLLTFEEPRQLKDSQLLGISAGRTFALEKRQSSIELTKQHSGMRERRFDERSK